MKQLFAPNEIQALTELTYLAVKAEANDSSITVDNVNGFDDDDYIVIGTLGSEKTELLQIGSISEQVISFKSGTQLSFGHAKEVRIQKILYNQRMFHRDTVKTGAFVTLIDTKNIEVDRPNGTFCEDSTGTSSHYYKATYYNSDEDIETSLDDAVAVKADESNHYTSITDVRRQAGFEEAYGISDEMIFDYREEAENEFESRISSIYSVPLSPKPKLSRLIVNYLTAGNLLLKEYGMESDIEVSKSGARMLERANELIEKINNGEIKLIGEDGTALGTKDLFKVTGSNVYSTSMGKHGEVFNFADEPLIKMKDPDSPRS